MVFGVPLFCWAGGAFPLRAVGRKAGPAGIDRRRTAHPSPGATAGATGAGSWLAWLLPGAPRCWRLVFGLGPGALVPFAVGLLCWLGV